MEVRRVKRLKDIVIVGGGTSAWLTAAYLSNNHDIRVTVIDKEIGNPIGVGEATLLNFKDFLDKCNLPIEDWFNKISATSKVGILFPDWVKKGHDIWHPFAMNYWIGGLSGVTKYDLWSSNQHLDFKKHGSLLYDLSVTHEKINSNLKVGYHIDCGKLTTFIQSALERRVNFIQSEMTHFDRDGSGNISLFHLKNGKSITGDLFIDCTGFLQLLKNKPVRKNLDNRLICDTAVAGRINEEDIKPYVNCTAKPSGWIWHIPTQERLGTGYVFNRSLMHEDVAKQELSNHHNGKIKPEDMKVLNWKPYYNENPWHENVVSIGLSAGFIEPLESTGLALIIEGVRQLSSQIKDNTYNKKSAELYNNIISQYFESSIDFVGSHYTITERDEPFWQEAKSHIKISDRQNYYMDMLKNPNTSISCHVNDWSFLTDGNWTTWLIQQGCEVAKRNINGSLERLDKENHVNPLQNPLFGINNKDYMKYLSKKYA